MLRLQDSTAPIPVVSREFLLLIVAEFLLSSKEDDTRSWGNFLVYFQIPCQPEGLGYIFIGC